MLFSILTLLFILHTHEREKCLRKGKKAASFFRTIFDAHGASKRSDAESETFFLNVVSDEWLHHGFGTSLAKFPCMITPT